MLPFLFGLWILFCLVVMTAAVVYWFWRQLVRLFTQAYSPNSKQRVVSSDPVNVANRAMQTALLQLNLKPDFRHAAAEASKASGVPEYFRQRQFQRFKPQLIDRFANLLREGISAENLMPQLTELAVALGVSEHEAEYIRNEAQQRAATAAGSASGLSSRLRQAQGAYRERVQAIKSMKDLDAEIREQLLEQERVRFEERMRRLTGGNDGDEDE